MSHLLEIAEAFLQIHLSKKGDSSAEFDMGAPSIDDACKAQRQVIAARESRGERVVGHDFGPASPRFWNLVP
jgi:hypothetical protein